MYGVASLGGHSDPLQIREPASPVFIVGMADMITGYRPFATDLTFFCHDKTPDIDKTIIMVYAKTRYIHVLETDRKFFLK